MKFTLLFNLLIVSAYNIDTNYPILYPNSANNADQYLYTKFEHKQNIIVILLIKLNIEIYTYIFLTGAPRGNYTQKQSIFRLLNEPGIVYRCSLPGSCVEIEPTFMKDEEVYVDQLKRHVYIKKEHSWFGGAMSIEKYSGFLTVCAPRVILRIFTFKNTKYMDTLQGMCYSGETSSATLKPENSEITSFDFSKNTWYDPIHGFSVAFAPLSLQLPYLQNQYRSISRIVGRPNDNVIGSVNIGHFWMYRFNEIYRKTTDNIPIYDNLSKFGYAVTSGYYFHRNQPLYACADPGWNYVGVVIVDLDGDFIPPVTNLRGNDIGEFFGACLASGDLNNDGLYDLVVGAPHWGNDNGRIHIYLGSSKEEFEAVTILKGTREDAQFGYAVAVGDVDGDDFCDIIVSAPWEESGAIYIYNGDTSLKDKVKPTMSQRITMQSFSHNPSMKGIDIQTFGFSISEPIDIDNNGYADIAVGAYKSGHVIVLRSKPIVRTNLIVYTIPSTLQRNISNFLVEACVKYQNYNITNIHAFKVSLIVDQKYKRTKETLLEMYSMDASIHTCVNATITISNNIQDFIEPITIYASHDFTYNDSSEFCKTCPIESKNSKMKSVQVLLPFDIECGEDRVCNSNIHATVKLWGVRQENNTWIIGSNDITLETHLKNYAEPAYLTTIVFTLPKEIVLRSILSFCEEDTDEDILTVICNVGNPFGTDEQKVVKLDLDMRHLTNGSLHGQVLEFFTEIRTRSTNNGTHMIKSPLILQSEAFLLLNGKAIEKSYYLSNLDSDRSNIVFQHVYQILKFGETPIEEARLVVNLPTAISDSDSSILLYKPQIYISGKYYDCLSNGVNLMNIQQGLLGETTSDASNLYNLDYNNKTLQNATHDVFKRNADNYIITFGAHILQTLYILKMAMFKDSNANLTIQERNIIYMNCSTYGVNCSTIYCDLNALKTQQDIGKLVIRLILNITKLKDNFKLSNEMKIIKINTNAYVEIIKPANRIFGMNESLRNIYVTRHNINVTTEFYNTTKTQKLQLWVVLVSVSLGLILLCIVVIILNKLDFFKRKTKDELFTLKSDEVQNKYNKIDRSC
ncbi:Integrin alpha-PS3 [Trachymyrmex septentrionalis]|uniref:Integrin alpha-PS3 n=1 Tax=Trachymyrmex septentrionalis TaxID=34720 RepID=A0A195ERR3_9HYME|nr:Integrin alpha-PS3 [Trachymyrmex septentrionalis]